MNYKVCELHIYNLIKIRTKYTFHSNSSLFSVEFPLLWNVASAREWDFTAPQFWWSWVFVHLRANIADDAMQMDVHKTLYPFYATKKMPHVTVTITKNAWLAAVARYISITTIYTGRNLQIFNAGHFFSSKHCNDLLSKNLPFGLPWFSTKPQTMTLFYLVTGPD